MPTPSASRALQTQSPSPPNASDPPLQAVDPSPGIMSRSAAPMVEAQPATTVRPGVDVLLAEQTRLLLGRRLGLVTNATGRGRDGRSTIDLLFDGSGWQLAALFSPEHGIRGQALAGQRVDSSVDERTQLPIYSLYGQTIRPTQESLRGLDTLVYDIQDVGARTYTYISTLLEVMRAATAHHLAVLVLDRPNPIGGDRCEGNVLDPRFTSFVGPAPIAMRYGMTVGELSQLFNVELGVGADLTVVPVRRWTRDAWFDRTGLAWVNPSPNIRSVSAAGLYPGTVLVEGTNLSEGRGADRPFEWVGAPWIDGPGWADALNASGIAGARFAAADKTPDNSKFAGQRCHGVAIEIIDRRALQPMELGVAMIATARSMFEKRLELEPSHFDRLAGTDRIRTAIEAGTSAADIAAGWQADLQRFRAQRERYLLY